MLRDTLREWGRQFLAPSDVGVREVEYSFITTHIPSIPSTRGLTPRALDFGSGFSWLGLAAARLGYETTVVDLRSISWPFIHPKFFFQQRDLLDSSTPADYFDLVINCSSIEHVGLKRYGGKVEDVDADLKVMGKLRATLKGKGLMLLTTNIGQDAVHGVSHRTYGRERLPLLLEGWAMEKAEYWKKNSGDQWAEVEQEEVFKVEGSSNKYALGLFVLRKARA